MTNFEYCKHMRQESLKKMEKHKNDKALHDFYENAACGFAGRCERMTLEEAECEHSN